MKPLVISMVMTLAVASTLSFPVSLDAQAQAAPPQSGQPERPRGQIPDLGRPTRPDDEMPLFNFEEYFVGKWTFEWNVPETVFGEAGTITGTTVYTKVSDVFYEGHTEATGPEGAFTFHETIAYQKENRTAARHVTDSRGFSYLQSAKIGGDLGGYFNMHFESAPFTYKGKTLRIRNSMRLLSPVQFRNVTTLSTDGGPFINMSDPWWRKTAPGTAANR